MTKSAPSSSAKILVVEDEFLAAMEVESILLAQGLAVLGPAATVADALGIIAQCAPDAAVLDVNLRGTLVTPIALTLVTMKVPFVLVTAYDVNGLPAVLRSAVRIAKPVHAKALIAVVAKMLRSIGA